MNESRRRRRRGAASVLCILVLLVATACGIPRDPDGTLDRIAGGELRVGASPHGDLVFADGGNVAGTLADVIEGFADEHDATVVWTVDSEERLVDDLESGALDLAIGGMTDATPWSERVSVTRGYTGLDGAAGDPVVVLLPLGENGLQAALEQYLDREVGP